MYCQSLGNNKHKIIIYRTLDIDKITDAIHLLSLRIKDRFPEAGLLKVCLELKELSIASKKNIERVNKPYIFFRIAFYFLMLIAAAALYYTSYFIKKIYTPHQVLPELYIQVTFIVILISVFALTAIIIFRFKIVNARYENIINEQKLLVEHKNKDIMDSIHYAKRIQRSLLPTEKYIDRVLGENKNNIKEDAGKNK